MKSIDKINSLLADLISININLHNLHWNVKGDGFEEFHELTEELYDDIFGKYDDFAESLKIAGHYPVASLKEYAKLSNIGELEVRDYSDGEVIDEVIKIYEYLIECFKSLRMIAIEEDNFVLQNNLEDIIADYSKKLWLVKARKN